MKIKFGFFVVGLDEIVMIIVCVVVDVYLVGLGVVGFYVYFCLDVRNYVGFCWVVVVFVG